MGLFDKKYCSVCGEKIGLFGNRKLEDGNLCKYCAKKLSYWFDDRRHSTVDEIKAQLAYREENQQRVNNFNITRTFGRGVLIVLDEDKRQFAVVRTKNMRDENPDILDYSQVTGCDLDIDEDRSEEKRETPDGKEVSYNPPRYTWSYDFRMTIRVNHPYFDDMRFNLNNSTVHIEPDYSGGRMMGPSFNPRNHPDYKEYVDMGNEIKKILMQIRQETRDSVVVANAPKTPVVCPTCSATTVPDERGCCEYCGRPIN